MLSTLLVALLLGGQQAAPADHAQPVRKGMRLEVRVLIGDVEIRSWDRDEVKVETDGSGPDDVSMRTEEAAIVIRARPRPAGTRIDYRIVVPRWMGVKVEGRNTDVVLDEVGGDVSVETMRGNITVRGGNGVVSAHSLAGRIAIERARGRIEARTAGDSIRLADVVGDVVVGTMGGRIDLAHVDTANLDAYTVNGGIAYEGAVKDKGIYRITTHNGRIAIAVPQDANATLNVRTFGGRLRSSFPVQIENAARRNRFTATIGNGSAQVELESFNGDIDLHRPGEQPAPNDRERSRPRRPVDR